MTRQHAQPRWLVSATLLSFAGRRDITCNSHVGLRGQQCLESTRKRVDAIYDELIVGRYGGHRRGANT